MEFTSDFECGAGRAFEQLNRGHYQMQIPADPENLVGGDYRWYFCVRVANLGDTQIHLTLDARRPGSDDIDWMSSAVPVFASEDFETWQPLLGAQITPSYDYRLSITLDPGRAIYVANSLPHGYEAMCDWLRQIQTTYPTISRLTSIGRSVQGRDILLLTITETPGEIDTEKDRILITSGMHPAEPDWLATKAIIEALLSDAPWACDARQKYIFDIVAQLNPDGFVLGMNGCNANGVNLYWDFHPRAWAKAPETAFLWDWIEAHPHAIYLDFHCYVHNLQKDYQPYLKPTTEYRHPMICHIVSRLDSRLVALSQGRAVRGELTTWRTTLAYHMTAKYDTITYTKYHLHLKHGADRCRNLAVAILRLVVDTVEPFRPLKQYQGEITPTQRLGVLLRKASLYSAYHWLKRRTPTPLRATLRWVRPYVIGSGCNGSSAAVDADDPALWPWYEDVCAYFGISPQEALRRATQGDSKRIWLRKEQIESSEQAVIEAWTSDIDMVIRNGWYREVKARTDWRGMLNLVNYKRGDAILDYGCGVSSLTKWILFHAAFDSDLAAAKITLADLDRPILDFCRWRYGDRVEYVPIHAGTGWQTLLKDYDIIFCLDVLEHLWSPLETVKILHMHLKLGGRLVETFIDDTQWSNLTKANRERPDVFAFLSEHMMLTFGSINESQGLRVWQKKVS